MFSIVLLVEIALVVEEWKNVREDVGFVSSLEAVAKDLIAWNVVLFYLTDKRKTIVGRFLHILKVELALIFEQGFDVLEYEGVFRQPEYFEVGLRPVLRLDLTQQLKGEGWVFLNQFLPAPDHSLKSFRLRGLLLHLEQIINHP